MTQIPQSLYDDALAYDLIGAPGESAEVQFYLDAIKNYGEPVLEMACGTGRLTIPLASRGIHVVGLDVSRQMLDRARQKAIAAGLGVQWIEQDCRSFQIPEMFAVIFFPLNSFCHVHEVRDVIDCLSTIRRHLKSGGRFIVDVFNPSLAILTRDPQIRFPVGEYVDPRDGLTVTVEETSVYDAARQVNDIKWYFHKHGSSETIKSLSLRMFYPRELEALLSLTGFEIAAEYGDYDNSRFTAASMRHIVVAQKN